MIELKNIKKKYIKKGSLVVNGVDLNMPTGSFNILIGKSGCGKSTILKIISNLEKVESGEVKVEGEVSLVFQSGALLPWKSVFENVKIALNNKKDSDYNKNRRVVNALKSVGLEKFKDKLPRDLSGGQRQRVGLARAIALNREILLLDEAFAALDISTCYHLYDDLINLWQNDLDLYGNKKTILAVSHSIEEAVLLGENIYLMDKGKILKYFKNNNSYPRDTKKKEVFELIENIRKEILSIKE